jgi:YwiC-like protein
MPQTTAQPAPLPKPRVRALIIPREHGAWGMLLVPLLTGAAVGMAETQRWEPLALFTGAALALFWLRTPLETAMGASPMRAQSAAETNSLLVAIAGLGSAAMLCLVGLLWHGANRGLWLIGAVAALAFFAQGLVKKLGRKARMPAQMIGAIGLTSTAAGAYYVVTGHIDPTMLGLWFANWIFAGNQIHFVQLRIHAARAATWAEKFSRGGAFFAGQFAMIAALLAAWHAHLLPGLALIAFAPVLVRGLLWFVPGPQPLVVRRLGWTELSHAVAFGVLLVVGFLR